MDVNREQLFLALLSYGKTKRLYGLQLKYLGVKFQAES